ncbi:SAM-dependent methyltransferase [Microbacterium testaceum]|uniref:SAM-dependent methyltransferase n=1 Tax=Microbacterium testaceum TaxID=2033 RepID=A0A147F174_MICTE|nr:methyltransferase [Microbacterium testaceum]KTR96659.1 SAM-dependent methyltransferase [Microbacterium testaceum]
MLPEPDPTLCHLLADDLRAAGYSSAALRSAWGVRADDAISRGLLEPALRALGDRRDPLAVLGRLWGLGRSVPIEDLAPALPSIGVAGAVALGLAAHEGDTVTPAVLVRPQAIADADGEEEWWIASDLDEAALGGPLPEDHVLGVGGASQTLARLQVTWRAASALDIGTGCGIQALRLRRLVPRVVATDISERALRFTRLNALLNDVDGIETRHGSLFDPVAGETFERVASNPPFVITPRVAGVPAYEYRDGGLEGDALVASVIAGVGAHLAPGGLAQSLGNWEYRDGESGLDRVKGWVDPALDAWVIEREVLDPLAYAELWVRDGGTVPGTPAYARLIDAWLEDFDQRGVTGIGFGYVLLRRPLAGGPTLERYERVASGGEAAFGPHLAACLEEHDRAALLDDDGLADATLRVSPDVTEARHHHPGEEAPSVIELRQGGGFARTIEVDPALAALVGACDGDLSVGPLIGAIAELLDVDADDLRADLLPRVRELIVTGFLRFLDA